MMRRVRADRPSMMAEVWRKVQTLACQQPKSQGVGPVRSAGARGGLAAQHRTGDPERVGAATPPDSNFQPSAPIPNSKPSLLDIVGLYLNPPENALLLWWTRSPVFKLSGSDAAAVAASCKEASQLDQRICSARNPEP